MTRGVENTLLTHGGTEDIDIPYPALQRIVEDALKPDCDDMVSQLRLQNDELLERNEKLANLVRHLETEARELRVENRSLHDRLDGREFE